MGIYKTRTAIFLTILNLRCHSFHFPLIIQNILQYVRMSCCFDKSQNDGHQWSHDRANSGIWCSTLLWAVCHFTAAVHRFFVISWALKMHTMEHLRRFSKISQFKWWELSTFEDIFFFGDKSFCLYFSFSFFLYIGVKPSISLPY